MTLLEILAILLGLSALFGFFNHLILHLPHTIGIVVIALFASGCIVGLDYLSPELNIGTSVRSVLQNIDFHETLMRGFLSALLFAGAIHIDLSEIAKRKWAIGLMATIGVLISTAVVGAATWALAGWLGLELPFMWALVFGALISPTDPIAVLSILKTVSVPPLLQAKITGESLFNDGVGVVVFTILLALAVGSGAADSAGEFGALDVAWLFIVEVLGGAVLGFAFGLLAFAMMRALDEHNLEIMITLALVTGTYAAALHLHLSGPIAIVVAGLFIGNHGARFAMSDNTRQHVFQFWDLTDEILNSLLFLLIGLEVLVIGMNPEFAWFALASIPTVLLARLIAVSIPIGLLAIREKFTEGAIQILTWGVLRGGISVALALSLPDSPHKAPLLTATYAVVVFSIIVQGLTMKPLVARILEGKRTPDPGREAPEEG